MATVVSVTRYHIAGLPASVLSAVEIRASVRQVAFGRIEGHGREVDLCPARQVLRQWWTSSVEEPSFISDFTVTRTEAPIVQTGLLKSDPTLTQAATCVAFLRALADRVPLRALPSLEKTIIVGDLTPDGTLSCPSSCTSREIAQACRGSGAQCLVGPFVASDPASQDMLVQPVVNSQHMFQFALGSDPEKVMRLALEWLVLFDSETQGSETDLWREAERRAAENLSSLVVWFEEVRQRLPHSRVIQAALTALKSLAKFCTEENLDMVERTLSQLEATGYHLTTVWLLTRWAFLLREQRQEELANQCLERAAAIQASLPLTQPVPILLHQVGRRYYYQARFADALRSYWDGYRFLERTPGKDDLRADFYNSAGKCFNDTYQFALALELFERARQIRAKLRHNETLARSWGAMGEVYWRVGDLDDAERCFRQDIELSQQADRARNERREEMRAKNYLANVLFAKGAWDDAETLYRETETYYRARFEAGNTNEFRNLAYSLEGLARTAAARGQWDEVARQEQRDAEHAQRLLTPDDPAILPVALLRYLHALKWQHEHATVGALTRLYEVEKMLEPLYPLERAMVGLEIIILEISRLPLEEPLAISASTQRLELASTSLRSLLDVREKPEVMAYFAPICQEIEQGRGALEGKGQIVFAQDRQRREKLLQQFAAASRLLAAGNWDAATPLLREIQESVVFFRDIIKQVAW